VGVIFLMVGAFVAFCSIKDFDWFMNNRKARIITKFLTRRGARYFYTIIGVIIFVLGGEDLMGIISLSS
jgi:hypothetical protein